MKAFLSDGPVRGEGEIDSGVGVGGHQPQICSV